MNDEPYIAAERIILIENLTSYEQWVHQRLGNHELVIFTGGFPRKSLQTFFKKLSNFIQHNNSIPVYHWGDIDVGGILIFNFIKNNFFPTLHPLLMDVETLLNSKERAMEITNNYRTKIIKITENPDLINWRDVAELMLKFGIRLEQESIYDVSDLSFKYF